MELGSIGLGLLSDGVFCWPVPTEPMEFWIPPAGDPKRAIKREKKRKRVRENGKSMRTNNSTNHAKNQQNTHIVISYVLSAKRQNNTRDAKWGNSAVDSTGQKLP